MYIHVHNIHVLMRDERRKEERSKQDQTNNKAKHTDMCIRKYGSTFYIGIAMVV